MLERIAGYLRAQNWNAIAIEFLIVTAGVLMGIQVSNWNESRLEKARVDQQLVSLRTELESNLATIERFRSNIDAQLADIVALERAFDSAGNGQVNIDGKLMNIFRIGSLILETNAYDELNDSGDFRHVAPDIRAAMTEWQARKGLVARVDADALNYRMSMVDHLFGVLAFDPMVKNLAPAFEPASSGRLSNDPARLARDPKIRNFLAMRFGIETQKRQFAEQLEGSTKRLIALLK